MDKKSREKAIFLWPVSWFITMYEVWGYSRAGKLHASSLERQVRVLLIVAVIVTVILALIALLWFWPVRIILLIGVWIAGMIVRGWTYYREVSFLQWIGEISQAVLFGTFWGVILSLLVSLLSH